MKTKYVIRSHAHVFYILGFLKCFEHPNWCIKNLHFIETSTKYLVFGHHQMSFLPSYGQQIVDEDVSLLV